MATGAPVRPVGNSLPQAGCIQAAFVGYQRLLANTRVLACLRMYGGATVLRTRPPVGEEGEEVQDQLKEEFADVLAWLATLANITDVDLDEAVRLKYVEGGGPAGTK